MSEKCFLVALEEFNGERCYRHDVVFKANNMEEAGKKVHEYMMDFYGDNADAEKVEDNRYEYFFGQIAVEVNIIEELEESDIRERLFQQALA